MKKITLMALLFSCSLAGSAQKWVNTKHVVPEDAFDTIAQTPPMGWNSWNCFEKNINENVIRQIADVMVSSGMKDAGYSYLVLDDFWMIDRDEDGNILADPEKFPHGMKALADYIHSKGLKFGLYLDLGTNTCGGSVGSRGYEYQDALQLARWGVDFTKVDWCSHDASDEKTAYLRMRDALKNSGRPILFSLCEWGKNAPWTWGAEVGQMWRVSSDLVDCFSCTVEWGGLGVLEVIDIMAPLYQYAGPGHWNDADMLQIGNLNLSETECITQFSMWCMLAAPLFAGNDLLHMTPSTREILTNSEAIAVNQDSLGKQAIRCMDYGEHEIWLKPLSGGDYALCFLNRGEQDWKLNYDWKKLTHIDKGKTYTLRDLWKHRDIGNTDCPLKTAICAHGVLMLRLTAE